MKRVDVNRELIQPALGTMERQLRHRTRLIDDLLDASRISQGKISNSNPIATATPVQAVDDIS